MSGHRRTHGSGSLTVRRGKWYGRWRVGDRQIGRVVGPIRPPGSRDGLTKSQAEARLRRMIEEADTAPKVVERITVGQTGRRLISHLTAMGRKRSTIQGYESIVRVHLAPHFGDRPIGDIGRRDVEGLMAASRSAGRTVKTTLNHLGVLHSIFEYALREEWVQENPCRLAAKPQGTDADPDIHYLDQTELEALIRAVPDDDLGRVERVLYLTAATTGMRQGELLALRWMDVDWSARRVRVRRSYVRGEYGTPKSRRSSRAVPLADRVAGQLDQLHRQSAYQADDDLAFAHPHTGNPIDRSKLLKRFKTALRRAGVRDVLPRSSPHLRDPHGRPRRPDARASGDDGPPRLQDDPDLRRLRSERNGG